MSSRQTIFDRLRGRQVSETPLPSHDGPWITFEDRAAQFQQMVQFVGGQCTRCHSMHEAIERGKQRIEEIRPTQIVSLIPELVNPNVDLARIDDPHQLAAVDLVVAEAEFGVAESGALWFNDSKLVHRAILFITQHLMVVIRKENLVEHLHQAYARLEIHGPQFGMFLSGPSKTADIEQSLVLGAHGSRTLEVLLIES